MTPIQIPGIENGCKVDDLIWRGAQPDDSAWPLLAAAGCKSVIDLSNAMPEYLRQLDLVERVGMRYDGQLNKLESRDLAEKK